MIILYIMRDKKIAIKGYIMKVYVYKSLYITFSCHFYLAKNIFYILKKTVLIGSHLQLILTLLLVFLMILNHFEIN